MPASAASRAKLEPAGASSGAAERQALGQRGQVGGGLRARAGARNSSTSTPGGPRRVRARSVGSSIAAQRLSAVCREPTSTVRGPLEPLARGREEALGLGLDRVLERAAVDLDRVGDVGAGAPAPGRAAPSRGARRARRRAAPGRRRRARRRRSRRRRPRPPRRCSRRTAAPRRPRSGPGRRWAAARRARAATRSRAPAPAARATAAARPSSPRPRRRTAAPRAGGSWETQVDHVPLSRERRDEAGGVDVRPRPVQEVAVGDEQPHGRRRTLAAASVAAAGGAPAPPNRARDPSRGAPLVARGRRSSPHRTARAHRPSPRLAVTSVSCQVPDRWRGPEHEGPAERSWRGDA